MHVTKKSLQALAGWAISRQGSGGQHDAAMLQFVDGCEAVIPFVEDTAPIVAISREPPPIPKPQVASVAVTGNCESGRHKFHLRTQCCIFCGQTYLQVMGRKPEILGHV